MTEHEGSPNQITEPDRGPHPDQQEQAAGKDRKVKPAHPRTEYPETTELNRRTALVGGSLAVAGVAAERFGLFRKIREWWSSDAKFEIDDPERDQFVRPFEGKHANDIANLLAITAGNFWMTEGKVMESILQSSKRDGYLTQQELLPIFPPAVIEQQEVITRVAKELGVPPNVVATISSVESAGNPMAASSADAHGLFQVVPKFHLDKIIEVAAEAGFAIPEGQELLAKWTQAKNAGKRLPDVSTENIKAALQNSYIGCKVGMLVLKDYYQEAVDDTDLNPDSPITWARALAAYNGGPDEAGKKYENMPLESQLYSVHAMRYFMTAEIASQLRNIGLDDVDIAKELVSEEIDARAFAYFSTKHGRLGSKIGSYEDMWIPLSKKEIEDRKDPELATQMKTRYEEHKRDHHEFDYPVSAGLRLWLVHGGNDLYFSSPQNRVKENYPANQK